MGASKEVGDGWVLKPSPAGPWESRVGGHGKEKRRSPLFGDFVVVSRGGGSTLTRESFDGLHRPVLVGAVHESIAGFDQELAAVGDLVLRKHFLQVGGGHALV